MSIKIKFRNNKAIVKFTNQMEQQWFSQWVVGMRDNSQTPHPQFIVRDASGNHLPKIKPIKPVQMGKGGKVKTVPMKISPEQMKKAQEMKVKAGKPMKVKVKK
jgi:hypothetical protein